jgi:hypothetical protein
MNASNAIRATGKKGVSIASFCLMGLLGLLNASAAPIIDTALVPYPQTFSIFRDSGTGIFVNGTAPDPALTVTSGGEVVIFSWNATLTPPPVSYSAAGSAGISLSAADSQYVLVLNGVTPVVAEGGTEVPLLVMPLFGNTPGALAGYGGSYITVTPDANGSWSFDMRAFAASIYGAGNIPSLWAVQLAFDPNGQEFTGYSFTSFEATIPEPSTVALLVVAGAGLVLVARRKAQLALR